MRVLWIVLGLLGLTLAALLIFGGDGTVAGVDGDVIARVVGLVAVLAVLLLGFASGRFSTRGLARNIAIWLALLVGLVLLYQSSETVRSLIN